MVFHRPQENILALSGRYKRQFSMTRIMISYTGAVSYTGFRTGCNFRHPGEKIMRKLVRKLMNLEEGYNLDTFWSEFNPDIRDQLTVTCNIFFWLFTYIFFRYFSFVFQKLFFCSQRVSCRHMKWQLDFLFAFALHVFQTEVNEAILQFQCDIILFYAIHLCHYLANFPLILCHSHYLKNI